MPTTHAIGNREEWLTARLARRSDELARRRLEPAWVRIGQP
jgi:hypothetical protein